MLRFVVRSLVALATLFLAHPTSALPTEVAVTEAVPQRYTKVRKQLPELVVESPGYVPMGPAQVAVVETLLEQGAFEEALVELDRARIELQFLEDYRHFLRGQALLGMNRPRDAAQAFLLASRLPDSRWRDHGRYAYAQALLAAKQPAAAARTLGELVQTFPQHPLRPDLDMRYAEALRQAGDTAAAGRTWQQIWLQWPLDPAANQAKQQLDALRESGIVVDPPSTDAALGRIRDLRRGWQIDLALAELSQLRQRTTVDRSLLYWEQALTYERGSRLSESLVTLREIERILAEHPGTGAVQAMQVRQAIAEMMARMGDHFGAAALLTDGLPASARQWTALHRRIVAKAADTLAGHTAYAEALQLVEQLAATARRPRRYHDQLAWLSFRTGAFDRAIAYWRTDDSLRGAYWRARAHQLAGRVDEAISAFFELWHRAPTNYYGLQARSRLVEVDEIALPATESLCAMRKPTHPAAVLEKLTQLTQRAGKLLPGLQRALYLWGSGAAAEARRELRLVALDYSWAIARGRRAALRPQPTVYRIWAGRPLPGRRAWGPRQRDLRRQREPIEEQLSTLFHHAGLDYWAWQFLPEHETPEDNYPQAFAEAVAAAAQQHDIDPNLLWAVMRTESLYRIDALSPVGARGLMQIMPHTGWRLAEERALTDFHPAQLFDAQTNIDLAAYYLKAIENKFSGQLPLVAAAYNGGPHNVALWLDQRGAQSTMDEFVEEIPFYETRRYVKKVVARQEAYERIYCGKADRTIDNLLLTAYTPHPNY